MHPVVCITIEKEIGCSVNKTYAGQVALKKFVTTLHHLEYENTTRYPAPCRIRPRTTLNYPHSLDVFLTVHHELTIY